MRAWRAATAGITVLLCLLSPVPGLAQTALEQLTFDEAIRRAITNNPTVGEASAGILQAQALLQQARSAALPTIDVAVTTNTIGPIARFDGLPIVPRAQTQVLGGIAAPLLVPVRWAERAQAGDQVFVAQQNEKDVQRQVAVAAAEAYLEIIARRRVVELNERARDNARDHFDFANRLYEGGLGSRLNAVRAQQEVSSDEAIVEEARLLLVRSQEALGVLVVANGPVDAAEDPVFDVGDEGGAIERRTDIQLLLARESAAKRVYSDSWKDYLPSLAALFSPQTLLPAGLFADSRSWRLSFLLNVPVFDSGFRLGEKRERLAQLDMVKYQLANTQRQARSEVRTAREAIAYSQRALAQTQLAASQANEVVQITEVAFREGARTNIEVIDAQREARDAETRRVIAEDAVRRSQLDLLVALGLFPQ